MKTFLLITNLLLMNQSILADSADWYCGTMTHQCTREYNYAIEQTWWEGCKNFWDQYCPTCHDLYDGFYEEVNEDFGDIYDLYNVEFLSEFYSWTMMCGYGISTEYETDPSYCNNPNLTIYDVINHQSNIDIFEKSNATTCTGTGELLSECNSNFCVSFQHETIYCCNDTCTDCDGNDCHPYINYIGDGECHYDEINFNCDEFNYDEGDCAEFELPDIITVEEELAEEYQTASYGIINNPTIISLILLIILNIG